MDRRQTHRAKVDLLVNRFLDGQPYVCRATDLSTSGMRLVPLLEPASDQRLRFMGLQFQLPGSKAVVAASAEAVTAAGADGMGVRFTKLPRETESALREFLAAS